MRYNFDWLRFILDYRSAEMDLNSNNRSGNLFYVMYELSADKKRNRAQLPEFRELDQAKNTPISFIFIAWVAIFTDTFWS